MLGAVRAQVHVLVAEHPPDPVFPPTIVVMLAKFFFHLLVNQSELENSEGADK
jgi:hypothetical protein